MKPVVVTAFDFDFRTFLEIFLRSLLKNGGIDPKRIIVFMFDFSVSPGVYERRCWAAAAFVIKLDLGVTLRRVPFRMMQKIRRDVSAAGSATNTLCMVDYLKCYLSRVLKAPYLWLDADMVVCKPIDRLLEELSLTRSIAMVNFDDPALDRSGYLRCFSSACGVGRTKAIRNNGLIFVPRDYSAQWKEIYRRVCGMYRSADVGQVVWNILFRLERGRTIGHQFNHVFGQARGTQARIVHFLLDRKDAMASYGF